jgi:hypothetical protein
VLRPPIILNADPGRTSTFSSKYNNLINDQISKSKDPNPKIGPYATRFFLDLDCQHCQQLLMNREVFSHVQLTPYVVKKTL